MDRKKLKEIIRFAVSGGVCFLIEFALLVLLRDTCGLDTLAATPIAFTVSVIVNYLFCVKWVFPDAGKQGNKARIAFFVTSVMGLFLNEGLRLFRAGHRHEQPPIPGFHAQQIQHTAGGRALAGGGQDQGQIHLLAYLLHDVGPIGVDDGEHVVHEVTSHSSMMSASP